jgi:hypothetical protein
VDIAAIVVINQGEQAFNFETIAEAVKFVENQVTNPEKAFNEIVNAFDPETGAVIGNVRYQVMDYTSYMDVYGDEEESDDE